MLAATRLDILVLSVFGDESHDETKQRVFAVGGLLGDDNQWELFRNKWRERTGRRVFHAADCEAQQGDFADMSESECQRLYSDLTLLLSESYLIGWGAAVDLAAAKREFPKAFRNQAYYSCFLRTVYHLADQAHIFVPIDEIQFIFDQNREVQYNAGLLYQYVVEANSWREPFLAETIAFKTRKNIGIQAADLWVRELMKRFDSWVFDNRSMQRRPWQILRSTNRFSGEFICAEYFVDLKRRLPEIQLATGMKESDYRGWIKKKRRQDNDSNRIEFMIMVNAKEQQGETQPAQ